MLKHYKRTYENFDKCMECIEQIVLIAHAQNNKEICKPIEELMEKLEVVN